MKIEPALPLGKIAAMIDCKYDGPVDHLVSGLNEIHKVEPGDLVFVDHPKYYETALTSAATTILINKEVECPEGKALIFSDDPFADYNKLATHFRPFERLVDAISTSALVGEGTIIQPNVTIGNHVTIGKDCVIHPGAVIYDHCVVGDRVVIHSNAVLGADAFYFQKREGKYSKMHSCGRVVIGDDVEIGAGCTIDRGVSHDTVIGNGSKLDNMVHVGHDTTIGENCLFAAHVGIAGCVTVEDNVTMWGQVGIVANITIGEGAVILGQSGVGRSVEGGKTYLGSPCKESREAWKELAAIRKLPIIIENL